MRLEILGVREERLVGRDERQVEAVGEIDDRRLGLALDRPCRAARRDT